MRWFGLEIGGGAGGPKSFPRQSQQTKEGAKVLEQKEWMDLMVKNGRRKFRKIKRTRKGSKPPTKGEIGTICKYVSKTILVKEVETKGNGTGTKRKQEDMVELGRNDMDVAGWKLEDVGMEPQTEGGPNPFL